MRPIPIKLDSMLSASETAHAAKAAEQLLGLPNALPNGANAGPRPAVARAIALADT